MTSQPDNEPGNPEGKADEKAPAGEAGDFYPLPSDPPATGVAGDTADISSTPTPPPPPPPPASGTPDIGSGTPDIGSGTSDVGSGTPDVGSGTADLASGTPTVPKDD